MYYVVQRCHQPRLAITVGIRIGAFSQPPRILLAPNRYLRRHPRAMIRGCVHKYMYVTQEPTLSSFRITKAAQHYTFSFATTSFPALGCQVP